MTGATGKLGRAVVRDLVQHGYRVVALDQAAGEVPPEASFTRTDLTDLGQVFEALTRIDDRYDGVDGVVHLAAIPAPGLAPNGAIFSNNVVGSWHVFSAAVQAGIRNVVFASSETVLGLPFDEPPAWAPVDETAPLRPNSTYSLGKVLDETMAGQLCRWRPDLKMIGLRFSNVMEPHDYAAFPGYDADPLTRKWNLWSYIDARDGAQAVRLALEHDATGFEPFIIANADTVMSRTSAELMAEVFPGVEIRGELGAHETLLSIDRARRVLGYEPAFSWRSAG